MQYGTLDKHIMMTASQDIASICKPLEDFFGITEFGYEKIYKDNSKIKLTNRPEWVRAYYQRGFHLLGEFEKPIVNIQSEYRLASTLGGQEIFKYCREYFNIDHSFVIIDNTDQYCEFFWFASTKDNSKIVEFYLNNTNLLRRFIFYFKDKASDIIAKAEKQRILLPSRELIGNKELILRRKTREDFINAVKVKRYKLTGQYNHVALSAKEFECALGLIEGKTSEEIGRDIFRSRRTIETHISTMKNKLACHTKSQLVNLLLTNGFGIYASDDLILI